jgi:Tfp pilus assembly protein PilV
MTPGRLIRCRLGFGIVSVLVAIVLIAIGVVALSSSSAFMLSLQTDAAERSRASVIGIAHMERLKVRPTAELVSEDPVRVNERGQPDANGAYVRAVTIAPDLSVPDALRAVVTVEYPSGFGRRRTLRLETVIYRGVGQ